MFKKLIWMLAIVLVILGLSISTSSADNEIVDIHEAQKIALMHVKSDMKTAVGETWDKNIKLYKATTLYDLEDNPSAYMFEFINNSGNDCGYVIVGATESVCPIIEFGYNGIPSIYSAVEHVKSKAVKNLKKDSNNNDSKIYYLGALDYLIELKYNDCTSEFVDLSTEKKLEQQEINEVRNNLFENKKVSKEKYKDLWHGWDELIKDSQVTNGNPPTSGEPISNPDDGLDSIAMTTVIPETTAHCTNHVFSDWLHWTDPTCAHHGLEYRYCNCDFFEYYLTPYYVSYGHYSDPKKPQYIYVDDIHHGNNCLFCIAYNEQPHQWTPCTEVINEGGLGDMTVLKKAYTANCFTRL